MSLSIFTATASTEIAALSLHDALPIAPAIRKPGLRAITGTVNVEYEGATFRDAIIADTSLVLLMTLTNGTDVVQVVIPEVRLNGNLPTSNGAERVTHDLAFEGLTSNLAIVTRTADAAL